MKRCILISLLLLIFCISQTALGQIYVGTFDEGKVIHINVRTSEKTEIVSGIGRAEDGVCSSDGTLFFADTRDRQILRFTQTGQNVRNILSDPTDLSPEVWCSRKMRHDQAADVRGLASLRLQ